MIKRLEMIKLEGGVERVPDSFAVLRAINMLIEEHNEVVKFYTTHELTEMEKNGMRFALAQEQDPNE